MQSMVLTRESIPSVYTVVIPVRLLFATSSFVQSTGIRSDTVFGNSTPLRRAYGASCIGLIFSLFLRWDSFYWCFRVCLYYVFPSYHMLNQCLKLDLYLLRSRVTSCLIPRYTHSSVYLCVLPLSSAWVVSFISLMSFSILGIGLYVSHFHKCFQSSCFSCMICMVLFLLSCIYSSRLPHSSV